MKDIGQKLTLSSPVFTVPELYPGGFLTVEIIVLFMYVTGKYTHAVFLLVMLISFNYPGNEVKSELPF